MMSTILANLGGCQERVQAGRLRLWKQTKDPLLACLRTERINALTERRLEAVNPVWLSAQTVKPRRTEGVFRDQRAVCRHHLRQVEVTTYRLHTLMNS
jgi:hypothetical protein